MVKIRGNHLGGALAGDEDSLLNKAKDKGMLDKGLEMAGIDTDEDISSTGNLSAAGKLAVNVMPGGIFVQTAAGMVCEAEFNEALNEREMRALLEYAPIRQYIAQQLQLHPELAQQDDLKCLMDLNNLHMAVNIKKAGDEDVFDKVQSYFEQAVGSGAAMWLMPGGFILKGAAGLAGGYAAGVAHDRLSGEKSVNPMRMLHTFMCYEKELGIPLHKDPVMMQAALLMRCPPEVIAEVEERLGGPLDKAISEHIEHIANDGRPKDSALAAVLMAKDIDVDIRNAAGDVKDEKHMTLGERYASMRLSIAELTLGDVEHIAHIRDMANKGPHTHDHLSEDVRSKARQAALPLREGETTYLPKRRTPADNTHSVF